MFGAERINRIKKILSEKKRADVSTLSSLLGVSEVTIRRDLEKLENEGYLVRSHGGAILNETAEEEADFEIPMLSSFDNYEELDTIGKICSFLVKDNDTLFIGPGVTGRFIARHLEKKRNIQVLTNDIGVVLQFSRIGYDKEVIFLGGNIDFANLQTMGQVTLDNLRDFHVNTALVEVDGVSMENGYSVSNTNKATITQSIFSASSRTGAVCDGSKFNCMSFSALGPIDQFRCIVSSQNVPENYKKYYFDHDIKLYTTFDIYKGALVGE